MNDAGGRGAVFVFVRTGMNWTQQGSPLRGTGSIGSSSQGVSVSITADGNLLAFGGYTDNSAVGAVWVFSRSADGEWSQLGEKLVGFNTVGQSWFGYSVSLSGDGTTLTVGGPYDDGASSASGAMWTYTRTVNPPTLSPASSSTSSSSLVVPIAAGLGGACSFYRLV